MKFKVEQEVFEKFEPLKVGIVLCKGVDNKVQNSEISKMFTKEKEDVLKRFEGIELAEYPIFKRWRQIYKSFGEKKNRCSVEALIRRTINGKEIPEINPLVDIYNTASIKFELPCGGEDLIKVNDDIVLAEANGTEEFLPLGEEETINPEVGEIVYKSGNTILCGKFNYRESDITKLTPNTTDAVLVVESSLPEDDKKLEEMLTYLAQNVEKYLGASCKMCILDKENNEKEI